MSREIEYNKYKEKGAYHWQDAKHSIFKFNAHQEARFEWILRCLGDVKGKTVLDIGCGDGALTYRIVKKGAEVIGLDNSKEGIDLAKEMFNKKKISANFILASAYKVPVKNDSIDCAVLSDVIEHVAEPEKVLKEIKRVLKNNGKVVISTPYRFGEILWDKYHAREYYPSELKSSLEPDFKNVEIIESHPALWMFLYTYNSRWTAYQPIFRWFTNILTLWFRFNPFLTDSRNRRRFDRFVQITAVAYKK